MDFKMEVCQSNSTSDMNLYLFISFFPYTIHTLYFQSVCLFVIWYDIMFTSFCDSLSYLWAMCLVHDSIIQWQCTSDWHGFYSNSLSWQTQAHIWGITTFGITTSNFRGKFTKLFWDEKLFRETFWLTTLFR